jgi:hypothetical protein
VGGWVPSGPSSRSGADAGTVYRTGFLIDQPADAEPTGAGDGSPRRSWGLFGGLVAAATLSLAGFVVAGNVGSPDRVVGTMGDPAPLLPGPPVLPPFDGVPSGAVDRSGKVGDLVGSAAAPAPPASSARSDTVPAGQLPADAPVPAASAPVPAAPALTPTPRPSGSGPGGAGPGGSGPGGSGPGGSGPGGAGPGGAGPGEVAVTLSVGSTVSLEMMSRPGHLVRYDSNRAVVDRVGLGSSSDERASARFTVRSGLADPRCVSFEADDRRRHFLRHRSFSVYLHRRDRTELFARDATFCPVPGATANDLLLRSLNYPDRYLNVRDSLLFLDPAGSPESSMFVVRPPV